MIILDYIKNLFKIHKIKERPLSYWEYQTQKIKEENKPEYLREQQRIENEKIWNEYSKNRLKHEIEKRNDFINDVINLKLQYGKNFIAPDDEELIKKYDEYISELNRIEKEYNLFLDYELFCFYESSSLFAFSKFKLYSNQFTKSVWIQYDDSIITMKQLEERFKNEYL